MQQKQRSDTERSASFQSAADAICNNYNRIHDKKLLNHVIINIYTVNLEYQVKYIANQELCYATD